jgi:hypothetical protein
MADAVLSAEPPEFEEVDRPGLSNLPIAVANASRRRPGAGAARRDAVAGLNGALASVPDGMASGLLAGVNPIGSTPVSRGRSQVGS